MNSPGPDLKRQQYAVNRGFLKAFMVEQKMQAIGIIPVHFVEHIIFKSNTECMPICFLLGGKGNLERQEY